MKRRRLLLIVPALALVAVVVYVVVSHLSDESPGSWPELQAAPQSATRVAISVERNVHVSESRASHRHNECVIAADPKNPKRLFAAAMFWRKGDDSSLAGYYSHDGGATWHVGFEVHPSREGERLCDESVEYGPDGALIVGYMRFRVDEATSDRFGREGPGEVEFQRSADGGKSWQRGGRVNRYIDRPWLTVDRTGGPRDGQVYWCGQIGEVTFGVSADNASTFGDPIGPRARVGGNPRPSQPVVFSDGSVAFVARHKQPGTTHPEMRVYRSDDGGASLREVGRAPGRWRYARLRPNGDIGSMFPQLAVSGPGTKYPDRAYCVWADGWNTDQVRVLLSRSDDRGVSWSAPVVVSEQSMDDPAGDYRATMPTVAVNADGVVAVCWYDCRAFPKSANVPGRGIRTAGYDVRLRASLDGGDSWGPSVKVNETSAGADADDYGHTAGLTATADGRFFPAWIDDRTGRPQLWTAACMVRPVE